MTASWHQNVAEAIEVAYGREMTVEDERFVRVVMDGFRYNAERRAILSFVGASDTLARYNQDAEWHAAVVVVVRTVMAGVFGEMPLDKAEKMKRERALEQMLEVLKELR